MVSLVLGLLSRGPWKAAIYATESASGFVWRNGPQMAMMPPMHKMRLLYAAWPSTLQYPCTRMLCWYRSAPVTLGTRSCKRKSKPVIERKWATSSNCQRSAWFVSSCQLLDVQQCTTDSLSIVGSSTAAPCPLFESVCTNWFLWTRSNLLYIWLSEIKQVFFKLDQYPSSTPL